MAEKLKFAAWLVGALVAVGVVASYGIWFWVSKNSWISADFDENGIYTHCLDFQFRNTHITGSMVTKFVPFKTEAKHETGHKGRIIQAAMVEPNLNERLFGNRIVQLPTLKHSKSISIHDGYPIATHIPDMNMTDIDGRAFGTVSFTLIGPDIISLPDAIDAFFKSTQDQAIERKTFTRSLKTTDDERCVMAP